MKRTFLVLGALAFMACGGGENGGGTDPGPGSGDESPKTDGVAESDGVGGGDVCDMDCGDKVCGPSNCDGQLCGVCEYGECTDGKCICISDCDGKECGDDLCGGTCGDCTGTDVCEAGQCVPCVPDCDGKECGLGGCGVADECGTCDNPDLPVCSKEGICIAACDLPDAWGESGRVTVLQSPADTAVVGTDCPDFSGDGKGDNGLKALASMINPELQKALDEGTFGILFEFKDVVDFSDTADFELVGLMGEPELGSDTNFVVDPAAYDEKCKALISFEGSSLEGGTLAAGPSVFSLDLQALGIDEVPLVLTIGDTQITGEVTVGAQPGVTVTDGILAGILTKELVDEALETAEELCDVPEPESFCSYLTVVKQFLPMLFDLDLDEDGTKDAASVCFTYELGPAAITGYMAE